MRKLHWRSPYYPVGSILPILLRMLNLKNWSNSPGRQAVCPGLKEMLVCLKRSGVVKSLALKSCQTRRKLVGRESAATVEAGKMMLLVWYFVRCIVYVLLNAGMSISVWDLVKFSNHNSRTLNDIRLIKVWFESLSTDYRQLSHKFDSRNDNVNTEFSTTPEQLHSMTIRCFDFPKL